MERRREKYSDELKVRVALGAIKGDETVQQLARSMGSTPL